MGIVKTAALVGVGYYVGSLKLPDMYHELRGHLLEKVAEDGEYDLENPMIRRMLSAMCVVTVASTPVVLPVTRIATKLGHPEEPWATLRKLAKKADTQLGVWGLRMAIKEYERQHKENPDAEGSV